MDRAFPTEGNQSEIDEAATHSKEAHAEAVASPRFQHHEDDHDPTDDNASEALEVIVKLLKRKSKDGGQATFKLAKAPMYGDHGLQHIDGPRQLL